MVCKAVGLGVVSMEKRDLMGEDCELEIEGVVESMELLQALTGFEEPVLWEGEGEDIEYYNLADSSLGIFGMFVSLQTVRRP